MKLKFYDVRNSADNWGLYLWPALLLEHWPTEDEPGTDMILTLNWLCWTLMLSWFWRRQ